MNKQKDHTSDSGSLNLDNSSNSTNLAGKFYFLSKIATSKWIVDSGATDHMCNSLESFLFTHQIVTPKHSITIPDGRKVMVHLYGDVFLMDGFILKNVLYVPDFQFYLIFVHKLCTDIYSSVVFTNVECLLQDHSKTRVLERLLNGLYYADTPSLTSLNSQYNSTCVAAQPSK